MISKLVTLRTAGFNTLKISNLNTATYLIMILFMFIGGASGSTAGGIKVNTVGVVYAYIRSILKSQNNIVLLRQSLSRDLVNQAFMIITLSVLAVFTGTLVLVLTEGKQLIQTMFEVVSAFGTVGLSTGITPYLSSFGKIVIITLMYIGRIGPLTVIMALSRKSIDTHVQYPDGQISIG
jgi:trk system potassium uptake protein